MKAVVLASVRHLTTTICQEQVWHGLGLVSGNTGCHYVKVSRQGNWHQFPSLGQGVVSERLARPLCQGVMPGGLALSFTKHDTDEDDGTITVNHKDNSSIAPDRKCH